MPVTNYHTVNGRLIGETTDGVRTDYLTDALGSVTATVDQSQNVLNTYRYKPYGGLLAKTGASADPRFLWTGDTGSRTTGLTYAEQYNRARHYGSQQAAWTSVDPLWPLQQPYTLVRANPVLQLDPSGYAPESPVQGGCTNTMIKFVLKCSHRKESTNRTINRKTVWCDSDARCDRCTPKSGIISSCLISYSFSILVNGYNTKLEVDFRSAAAESTCAFAGVGFDALQWLFKKTVLPEFLKLFSAKVKGGMEGYYTDCTGEGNAWFRYYQLKANVDCKPGCTDTCTADQFPIPPSRWVTLPGCHKQGGNW